MTNQSSIIILGAGNSSSKRVGPSPYLWPNDANLADGSQLARTRIIEHYKKQKNSPKIYLVATNENGGVRTHMSNPDIDIIFIKKQGSIIDSIKQVINLIQSSHVVLQPITTLPSQHADQKSWIEIGKTPIPRENWSALLDPKCDEPQFLFKNTATNHDKTRSHPFTGIISAPTKLVQQIINTPKFFNQLSDKTDLFYLAKQIWQLTQTEFRLVEWYDLGHYSTYSQTSARRLESRAFNHLRLCTKNNIIYKSSTDIKRLQEEASYLQSIDDKIKRFFPRLLKFEVNTSKAEIQMEYVPYPNVAELFLHWDIGRNTWYNIMRNLNKILSEIRCAGDSEYTNLSVNTSWLYSKKLKQRQEQIIKNQPNINKIVPMEWNAWSSKAYSLKIVNNYNFNETTSIELPSLNTAMQKLIKDLEVLEKHCQLKLIHGDLCFNNILVEPMSSSIKLIDPRGELPAHANWPIGYGDYRYDLIKILHSSRYLYDVIINDFFEINGDIDGNLTLKTDVPSHYEDINYAIEENIIQNRLSVEEERLLVSSLFLSMLPLHRENPKRCLAFSCIGLLILEGKFKDMIKYIK